MRYNTLCVATSTNSIRWKNFFLQNLFWGHSGKSQRGMISFSSKIKQITSKSNWLTLDVEEYFRDLTNITFSIYLTDSEKDKTALEKKLKEEGEEYVIITQSRKDVIEEYITTVVAKLYFVKKEGYLVVSSEIPDEFGISYGSGDVIGIKGGFVNKLKAEGIIPNGGCEEDFLIWTKLDKEPINVNEKEETIVCEIKTSNQWSTAYKQLYERSKGGKGYLKSHCFDKGYVCFAEPFAGPLRSEIDRKQKPLESKFMAGSLIFTIDPDYVVFKEDPGRSESTLVNDKKREELIRRANKYVARLMISGINAKKIIPNIERLNINQISKEIGNIDTVEKVFDLIS